MVRCCPAYSTHTHHLFLPRPHPVQWDNMGIFGCNSTWLVTPPTLLLSPSISPIYSSVPNENISHFQPQKSHLIAHTSPIFHVMNPHATVGWWRGAKLEMCPGTGSNGLRIFYFGQKKLNHKEISQSRNSLYFFVNPQLTLSSLSIATSFQ